MDRSYPPGSFEDGKEQVRQGAMQLIASRLLGQSPQESRGRREMFDGISVLEEIRSKNRPARKPDIIDDDDPYTRGAAAMQRSPISSPRRSSAGTRAATRPSRRTLASQRAGARTPCRSRKPYGDAAQLHALPRQSARTLGAMNLAASAKRLAHAWALPVDRIHRAQSQHERPCSFLEAKLEDGLERRGTRSLCERGANRSAQSSRHRDGALTARRPEAPPDCRLESGLTGSASVLRTGPK
jgi:hypothetical protein